MDYAKMTRPKIKAAYRAAWALRETTEDRMVALRLSDRETIAEMRERLGEGNPAVAARSEAIDALRRIERDAAERMGSGTWFLHIDCGELCHCRG